MSAPPTHIVLPPPPSWPQDVDSFFTPPSSPAPSPSIYFTPPTSPFASIHDPPPSNPANPPSLQTDDPFPPPVDHAVDLALDDDGLSTLEKIYLYSRSKAAFHRVFIAHALPEYLLHVTPQEAVEYVLPLLSGLAMDDDELVKEALAAELVHIVWWFFTHCQIIPDDLRPEEAYASSSTTVTISVQAFTPILGTLLLSSNPLVGGAARFAVVDLLSRMKKGDDRQLGAHYHRHRHSPGDIVHPWEIATNNRDDDDDDGEPLAIGLFGAQERVMFTQEILQQVVIGMGRLDVDYEAEPGHGEQTEEVVPQPESPRGGADATNPYFPPLPPNLPSQLPAHHPAYHSSPTLHEISPSTLRASSGDVYSPGTEFPPNIERSPASSARSPVSYERSVGSPISSASSSVAPGSPMNQDIDWDEMYDGEEGEDEQAAVGRLSSMSLMAAVTASGVLDAETQQAFVKEVERVGRDGVYWVRREASFALGALAKVVPEEVVISSLLPLFDALRWDSVWHVRHSALFALPAILVRLSPSQRRTIALETIVTLSADQNPTVRSGVLEALGEVIYTFHEDSEGPPDELIHLFLGRKEDRRVRDGQQVTPQLPGVQTPIESFYADPKRPLICAFNFPAVTLTLGGRRWGELREAYADIASCMASGVRRTLAASLGEIAKIIGQENAERDLLDVWWASIKSDEEEVRMKAIESLHDLISVVAKEVGKPLVQGLLTEWNEGSFRSWRERELIEQHMVSWVNLIGLDIISVARGLLVKGLEDSVVTVRETATSALPRLWNLVSSQKEALDQFRSELQQLATSSNYRRRMTFIACQQTLALSADKDGQLLVSRDEDLLRSVANLANDGIEGVRIGVARFAALIHRTLFRNSRSTPTMLRDLVHRLSRDSSQEVQSYVAGLSFGISAEDHDLSLANTRLSRKRLIQIATFSRPPLPPQPTGSAQQVDPGNPRPSEGSIGSSTGHDDHVPTHAYNSDELHHEPTTASGENESPSESSKISGPASAAGLLGMNGVYVTSFPDTKERFEFQGSSAKANERVTVPG